MDILMSWPKSAFLTVLHEFWSYLLDLLQYLFEYQALEMAIELFENKSTN